MGRCRFTPLLLVLLPAFPASAAILGVDVSHHQGSINWTSVKASGHDFAWAKISEGMTYQDPDGDDNMLNAAKAKVYIGAYHFARPDNNSPAEDALNFLDTAADTGAFKTDGYHLLPMLDLESGDNDTVTSTHNGHVGASNLAAWAVAWAKTVQAALNTTKKLPLYMAGDYLDLVAANATSSKITSYFDLWLAKPKTTSTGTIPSAPTASDTTPFSATWNLWQDNWFGSVSGISGNVDTDRYNGTIAQLTAAYVIPEPTTLCALTPLALLLRRRSPRPK